MAKKEKQEEPRVVVNHKRFWVTISVWLVFLFLVGIGLRMTAAHFENVVYPNVFIGEYNVGGKSRQEVADFVRSRAAELEKDGYVFSVTDDRVTIHSSVTGLSDLDLTYSLYTVDEERAVASVFVYGKKGSIMDQAMKALVQFFTRTEFTLDVDAHREQIAALLRENFSLYERPVREPRVALAASAESNPPDVEIEDLDQAPGVRLDYESAIDTFETNVRSLRSEQIEVALVSDSPSVTSAEFFDQRNTIVEHLQTALLFDELTFERATSTVTEVVKLWNLTPKELASFVGFVRNPNPCQACPTVLVTLNKAFDEWVAKLAEEAEVGVQDAKLVMKEGKIEEFQVARDGLALNRAQLDSKITNTLNSGETFPAKLELPMDLVKPSVETGDVNDLGIREIIGVGRSNFKGSPRNRRHNITVGAAAVNGALIPPGEEFSLLKVLGEVSGATGYLPELVIKGDKTIPEYGGGLCQIGTTTFRAALASGLPITARTNHSYRVQYYEPAGTDATIYAPSPDFRFLNDTGNYLLIQTKIQGDDLIFEFWGTRDGRQVEQTKPRIFNIVAPPEKKYIETLDLKPGEEKCTERAHAGADAEFTYTVTYADGTVKQQVFKSHYRPWQAVCLKGVKELSKPNGEISSE